MIFFSLRKAAPLAWYNKSCDLRASSGAIWFSMKNELLETISSELNLGEGRSANIWPVYFMLCGLSLELIYKAILVVKNEKAPTKHTLSSLANLAGIHQDQRKEDLLSILTEAIIWEGKYPVPMDGQQNKMVELSRLENRSLFDFVEWKGLKIPRPNNELGWDSFNNLWMEANEIFWRYRQVNSTMKPYEEPNNGLDEDARKKRPRTCQP